MIDPVKMQPIQPRLGRVFSIARRQQRVYFKNLFANMLPPFLEPLMFLVALGIGLAGYMTEVDGISYARFLVPAMIASSALFSASFEGTYGFYFKMEYERIHDAILGTPVSFNDLLMGELLWISTKCAGFSVCVLFVLSLFGLVGSWLGLMVIVVGFIGGICYGLMALLVSSMVKDISSFNVYLTGVITPMFYFSGGVFPLQDMPFYFKAICYVMPMTHIVSLNRAFCEGHLSAGMLINLAVLVGYSLLFYPIVYKRLHRRIIV